ncbi:MAG: serine hydrolase domain-containing protein [Bacteroidota bacterium]
MKTSRLIMLLCLFIFGFFSKGIAQADLAPVTNKQIATVEMLMQSFVNQANLPGVSIAVGKGDELIYAKGFGYANVRERIKMTTQNELRTASVAKVITATAIGKLLTERKLTLDEPIEKYIPYVPAQYANLTVRQLTSHTAGVVHRPKGMKYKKKEFKSIRETVEAMKEDSLQFTPDTQYSYSTAAFNLLAAVIEGVSGMSYETYMHQEIFKPLGMNQTYPENIKQLKKQSAKLYYIRKGKLKQERLTSASYKIAGAGFRSTPVDLVKMMQGYHNGFISKTVVDEMFASHQLGNGESTEVGVVWRTSLDAFGNRVVEHAGSWRGARTVMVYYPEEELSVAIMINATCEVFIEETAHMIAQIFRSKSMEMDAISLESQVAVLFQSNEGEKRYTGKFSLDNGVGELITDSKGFLKANPIFSLGTANDYVMITRYGILYFQLADDEVGGKLYLYGTRNKVSTIQKEPIAVMKLL